MHLATPVREARSSAPIVQPRVGAITVLIADDHALFREALRQLVDTHPDFQVIAEASDGREAVRLAAALKPTVALLDLHMPGMGGLEALAEIARVQPEVRSVIVAAEASDAEVVDALQIGARGIVMKHSSTELLFKSLRMVIAGQYWVGRECVAELIQQMRVRQVEAPADEKQGSFGLTPRELELVGTVVAGCSNDDIARQLKISTKTVKHHLTNIFTKTGVSNRLELALFAVQHRFRSGRFC